MAHLFSKPDYSKLVLTGSLSLKENIIWLNVAAGSKSKEAMLTSAEKNIFALNGRSKVNRGTLTISCRVFIKAQRNYIEAPLYINKGGESLTKPK